SFHKTSLGGKILVRHGIDYATILSIVNGMTYNGIGNSMPKLKENLPKIPAQKDESTLSAILSDNGIDLTARAKEGKLSPVFGREKEIERIIRILSRKYKNNPIIVGEPGVGKTAIVEGLAQRIADGNVPEFLSGKTIYSLNVNSLVSGTRYRGELEDKIKNLLAELNGKNIILFIDEMHTIVSAGSSEGGMNIGNILKPVLVGGELSTIGATTLAEYRKFIEKDTALERRFMTVNVEEPTQSEALHVLEGLKEKFEIHHGIKIGDEAVKGAVELSARYISERFLPDKAIDVLDEACSKKRSSGEGILTKEDVKDVISEMTGIPLQKLSAEETTELIDMEKILTEKVKGQDEAISVIAKTIRRARSGLKDSGRPVGSFLFLGSTGVGKTETAKALAEFLFGSENALIRFDMSEYMEKISASRLIGAPPGYVGYDEGGLLTEAVRRKPYCVVLFDEVEKAHPDVYDILLQVLDDGRLTDAKGRVVNFKNSIIIMTSNIGSEEMKTQKKVGFGDKTTDEKEIRAEALKKTMRPEFINRIDNIVVFNKLSKENIAEIANLQIERLKEVLKAERNVVLEVSEETVGRLAEKSFDREYGARPLKRIIETELEDKLSEEILKHDLKNTAVKIVLESEEPKIIIAGG
ncbi:MAG: ATP-dependent Clp protease ATP-binding subunit, partial [Christensenellales bacterium]